MQQSTTELVERHILESELHLRRIDEMMAKAREAGSGSGPARATESLLARIQRDRDHLARELSELRRQPDFAGAGAMRAQGAGLEGALRDAGAELEKVLTAILASR